MPTKKVLLSLDRDDYEKMQAYYGTTIGVSAALRKLIRNWLTALETKQAKEKMHD